MRKEVRAATGTLLFLVVAPGTVAGLVPWLLSRWHMSDPVLGFVGLRWVGGALLVAGIPPLIDSFRRFAQEGLGTPAPLYPTNRLIVSGLYRHVRNPMYLGVAAVIFGQALLLASIALLIWGAIMCLGFDLFVRLYEEPTLRRSYGVQFATYCASVPRWLPRLTPWHDEGSFAEGE
jgi:protein-S-isoprenylcysteine O-methyltransferase Ste14